MREPVRSSWRRVVRLRSAQLRRCDESRSSTKLAAHNTFPSKGRHFVGQFEAIDTRYNRFID